MKKVAELWVVLVRQPDTHQYTALCADRDSAEEWITVDMDETMASCGDDDEIEKFKAMTTVTQHLDYIADMFDKVYEIELRDILAAETTMDDMKGAVRDHHPVPEGTGSGD